MRNVVVTEGESDRLLLQKIFADLPGVEFVAAGGWSSADSVARSVLIRGKARVAVVVDADSTDPSDVEHRRKFLDASISEIDPSADRCIVVVAPTIEALLFEDKLVLEQVVRHPVDDDDWKRGRENPRETLKLLAPGSLKTVDDLQGVDLSAVRHSPELTRLDVFLHSGDGAKKAA